MDAGHSAGQIAFVKMLEQAAVVEVQVEFGVELLAGFSRERKQPRLAIGKIEALGIQQRLIDAVGRDRPLQRFVAFESVVGHSGEERRQRSGFMHDVGRMVVLPIGSKRRSPNLEDLPVGTATGERFKTW